MILIVAVGKGIDRASGKSEVRPEVRNPLTTCEVLIAGREAIEQTGNGKPLVEGPDSVIPPTAVSRLRSLGVCTGRVWFLMLSLSELHCKDISGAHAACYYSRRVVLLRAPTRRLIRPLTAPGIGLVATPGPCIPLGLQSRAVRTRSGYYVRTGTRYRYDLRVTVGILEVYE